MSHIVAPEIAISIVDQLMSYRLADLKNIRLVSWAFAAIMPPHLIVALCGADFGRSWGSAILWANAALDWPLWYIFPAEADHPVYAKPKIIYGDTDSLLINWDGVLDDVWGDPSEHEKEKMMLMLCASILYSC